jgi:hypothetical protein
MAAICAMEGGPTQCVNTVPSLTTATFREAAMATKTHTTSERLRELLDYDPATGLFVWLISPRRNVPVGSVAGTLRNGYIRIRIEMEAFSAHRLAWFYMTGEWPPGQVDHIDGNRSNNRWSNLRSATNSINQINGKLRSDSKTGYKGVSKPKRGKKWCARIVVNGKRIFLGMFPDPKSAHDAYMRAAVKYYGEFARPE